MIMLSGKRSETGDILDSCCRNYEIHKSCFMYNGVYSIRLQRIASMHLHCLYITILYTLQKSAYFASVFLIVYN